MVLKYIHLFWDGKLDFLKCDSNVATFNVVPYSLRCFEILDILISLKSDEYIV